jgi:hypothetical protein
MRESWPALKISCFIDLADRLSEAPEILMAVALPSTVNIGLQAPPQNTNKTNWDMNLTEVGNNDGVQGQFAV